MGQKRTKWTLEKVQQFYADHGCIFLDDGYKNMLTKYTFVCSCGNTHTSSFESFYKHSQRCKQCASKEMSKHKRLDKSEVVRTLEDKNMTYLNHYYESNEDGKTDRKYLKVDYKCREGHTQTGKYYHSIKDLEFGCMECVKSIVGDNKRLPLLQVEEIIKLNDMELVSKTYESSTSPLDVKCTCGELYTTTLASITHGNKCGCQRGGENHYRYNPELTEEDRQDRRQYPEYYQWVRDVYERDDYTCQKCGKRGGELHAHHIYSYAKYKDKRIDLANGVTLCVDDHKLFHKLYGNVDFTHLDFEEFMQ